MKTTLELIRNEKNLSKEKLSSLSSISVSEISEIESGKPMTEDQRSLLSKALNVPENDLQSEKKQPLFGWNINLWIVLLSLLFLILSLCIPQTYPILFWEYYTISDALTYFYLVYYFILFFVPILLYFLFRKCKMNYLFLLSAILPLIIFSINIFSINIFLYL